MGAHALSAEGRLEEVIEEHEAVFESLSAADRESARKNMDYHLERSRKKAETILFP
jgi:DNA-binding FadR family transcriptional regulator